MNLATCQRSAGDIVAVVGVDAVARRDRIPDAQVALINVIAANRR